MAKKQTIITTVQAPATTEQRGYSEGVWCGQVKFSCKQCGFDCLNSLELMLEHIMMAHSPLAHLRPGIPAPETISLAEPLPAPQAQPPAEPAQAEGIFEVDLKEVEDGTNTSQ